MSERSGRSPESLSPTHQSSSSPKLSHPVVSPSRTVSHSDTTTITTPADHPTKKSSLSFNLFDSILQRSVTKPLTINTTHEPTAPQRKLPTPTSSPSLVANAQLPEQARCLHSYNAIKEDEICVHKGEFVQIVAANQDNRWFVHRDANRTSPAAEGWIPGFVLGLRNPNSSLHHHHHHHQQVSPSPPLPSQQTSSSNSLQRLTSASSTAHHPTITYESTLPPKPQTSTCDKV